MQALRYGQIFGKKDYDFWQQLFSRKNKTPISLQEFHKNYFELEEPLDTEKFNSSKQAFIILTNGVDSKTREAILYWKSQGLDVRSWVYRIYGDPKSFKMDVEITPFRATDMPYEDKRDGFYFVNTNMANNTNGTDEATMFKEKIVATYFGHWKEKMNLLNRGDTVFLYRSGQNNGIVAVGEVDSDVKIRNYQGNPSFENEEYFRKLKNFTVLKKPLSPKEITQIIGKRAAYLHSVFSINYEDGLLLKEYISKFS